MDEALEVCFHALIDVRCQAMRLGVISGAHSQLCPCILEDLSPKHTSEHWITVRDNCARKSMHSVDVVHIKQGHFGCGVWMCQRNEIGKLSALINNYQRQLNLPD